MEISFTQCFDVGEELTTLKDVMHHNERAVELRPAGNCW
jgi:hypothetical protein